MSRVAFLLPNLSGGGAERVILMVAEHIATATDFDVDLILARKEGALLAEVPPGVQLIDLGTDSRPIAYLGLGLASYLRLSCYLRRAQPTVLLSTITGTNLIAAFATWSAGRGTKLILREAATLANITNPLRRTLMRILYSLADKVIALTDVSRKELLGKIQLDRRQVVCIDNPVAVSRIRRLGAEPLIHDWFKAGEPPVIVAAGRLCRQKDFATLIEALAIVNADRPVRLIIIGEGPERSALSTLARVRGVSDQLEMPGFERNPYRWLARAAVVIISSRWEGSPNVLKETIALGRPLLVTRYDESVDAYNSFDSIILTPVANAPLMAQALLNTLDMPPASESVQVSDSLERYTSLIEDFNT